MIKVYVLTVLVVKSGFFKQEVSTSTVVFETLGRCMQRLYQVKPELESEYDKVRIVCEEREIIK